jgi:hypothetical protein
MKYNFYEYLEKPRKEALPEDINEPTEKLAEMVGGETLLAACKKMRMERLFGDVIHIDKINNVADAKFTFNKGICKRAVLMETLGDDVVVQRSIHNSNLLMSKKELSNESNQ